MYRFRQQWNKNIFKFLNMVLEPTLASSSVLIERIMFRCHFFICKCSLFHLDLTSWSPYCHVLKGWFLFDSNPIWSTRWFFVPIINYLLFNSQRGPILISGVDCGETVLDINLTVHIMNVTRISSRLYDLSEW